jgi:hypothetical protein
MNEEEEARNGAYPSFDLPSTLRASLARSCTPEGLVAKAKVAGSNPVFRSNQEAAGAGSSAF